MQQFRDEHNTTWLVDISIGHARRLRDCLGIHLWDVGPSLVQLSDALTFVDALWVFCEDQAYRARIGEEEFAMRLGGDAYGRAEKAVAGAIMDFFDPRRREILLRLRRRVEEADNP